MQKALWWFVLIFLDALAVLFTFWISSQSFIKPREHKNSCPLVCLFTSTLCCHIEPKGGIKKDKYTPKVQMKHGSIWWIHLWVHPYFNSVWVKICLRCLASGNMGFLKICSWNNAYTAKAVVGSFKSDLSEHNECILMNEKRTRNVSKLLIEMISNF